MVTRNAAKPNGSPRKSNLVSRWRWVPKTFPNLQASFLKRNQCQVIVDQLVLLNNLLTSTKDPLIQLLPKPFRLQPTQEHLRLCKFCSLELCKDRDDDRDRPWLLLMICHKRTNTDFIFLDLRFVLQRFLENYLITKHWFSRISQNLSFFWESVSCQLMKPVQVLTAIEDLGRIVAGKKEKIKEI